MILLGIFGFSMVYMASQIKTHEIRYDDKCKIGQLCDLNLTVSERLVDPVIYYKLDNFYTNNKNYVKSKSFSELRGKGESNGSQDEEKCDHVNYMKDLKPKNKESYAENALDGDDYAVPCGNIAKFFFDDEYSLFEPNDEQIKIDETFISYSVDRN